MLQSDAVRVDASQTPHHVHRYDAIRVNAICVPTFFAGSVPMRPDYGDRGKATIGT